MENLAYYETPYQKGNIMQKFVNNLKAQAEANPVFTLATGAAVIQAVSKLVNVNTNRKNAKTWKKEVDRRTKSSRR